MEITEDIIKKVAKNARIELTEEEKKEFIPQLKEIVDFFSILNEVNTENIHASFQPITLKNIMREDIEEECLTQEEALYNTPHKKDGFFKGPKTF